MRFNMYALQKLDVLDETYMIKMVCLLDGFYRILRVYHISTKANKG